MAMSVQAPWPAVPAAGPVRATVNVPGSKSMTNRALVLAALSGTGATLHRALRSRDTDLMAAALRSLKVGVEQAGDRVRIAGAYPGPRGPATVDCGLAGTVMRFVPPLAALADGDVRFDGDDRARRRPMKPLLDALRSLGATVDGDGLPFVLHGRGGLPGGAVRVDAAGSSQFVSGLLLSAAGYEHGVTARADPRRVPSVPHIAMTVRMLRDAGAVVDDTRAGSWRVEPGPIRVREWHIEPDLSNAAVFLAAAAATGGEVTVPGWPERTTQPGDKIRAILTRMGCQVVLSDAGLTARGPHSLAGIDIDLRDVGELTPTVAALAALAAAPSVLRGIGHLRGHETDRLAALAAELGALGARVHETTDGLEIEPVALRADPERPWRAHDDHRMATAGALLGLVVPGLAVDDIGATGKTLPGFAAMWAGMVNGGRD